MVLIAIRLYHHILKTHYAEDGDFHRETSLHEQKENVSVSIMQSTLRAIV